MPTPVLPFSPVGLIVLSIFVIALAMDKFKPALMMMSSVAIFGIYYWFSGDQRITVRVDRLYGIHVDDCRDS